MAKDEARDEALAREAAEALARDGALGQGTTGQRGKVAAKILAIIGTVRSDGDGWCFECGCGIAHNSECGRRLKKATLVNGLLGPHNVNFVCLDEGPKALTTLMDAGSSCG